MNILINFHKFEVNFENSVTLSYKATENNQFIILHFFWKKKSIVKDF